jgi:lipopolysaccharide/colanic/teichoic acid biosynthesis glycosyltransferase
MMMRLIDLTLAALGLVILAPLLLVAALGVRRVLGPPVLFRQPRAGRGGRVFTILKFRTMDMRGARCCGDPRRCIGHQMTSASGSPPLAAWLRRTGIDELPQLINVLRGEMSLVGPRPLMVRYVPRYSPEQRRRLDVRPGITGWAQINGRTDLPWDERLAMDTWYVANRSVRLDLAILLQTFRVAVTGSGYSQTGSETGFEFLGSRPFDGRCPGDDAVVDETRRIIVIDPAR